ncbi:hypothetical protein LIER_32678 [Lithospermum erythrorhizon]
MANAGTYTDWPKTWILAEFMAKDTCGLVGEAESEALVNRLSLGKCFRVRDHHIHIHQAHRNQAHQGRTTMDSQRAIGNLVKHESPLFVFPLF